MIGLVTLPSCGLDQGRPVGRSRARDGGTDLQPAVALWLFLFLRVTRL